MDIKPVRIAVFGSYYQGKAVIEKILELQSLYPEALRLVGIATDDPLSPRVSPHKRIWRFATEDEYSMIPKIAEQNNVPVWTGSVKADDFYGEFAQEWRPDICYMATFGQRIPIPVFDLPPLGFYNFHPAVDRAWPSYTGGNPFQGMIDAKEPYCSIAMHAIDEEFDHGPLIAFSEPVRIEPDDTILSMYKKTSPPTAEMVQWHLGELKIIPPHRNYLPNRAPLLEQAAGHY
jgi:methionyl-tRNA formyltransferase